MKASAASWKLRKPFTEGLSLSYQAVFSLEDFARVQEGLVPQQMEDKWFIFYEEPYLLFHRSWTGEPVYRIELKATPEGARASQALCSKHLAAAGHSDLAYEAQLLDFLVSNLLLGRSKPFPQPAHVKDPMPGLYQHVIAGTGYKEVRVETKTPHPPKPAKPWWRFW